MLGEQGGWGNRLCGIAGAAAVAGVLGAQAATQETAGGAGFPSHDSSLDAGKAFVSPPPGYGEVPFWWWTGEKLDKARLLWELEELHKAGVSGTQINYAHTRSDGWKTAAVEPPIFSDAWWDVFSFVAKESAKRDMGIGLSGYTLDWPGRDNLFRQLGITADELNAHGLTVRQGDTEGGTVAAPKEPSVVSVTAFALRDEGLVPGSGRVLDPQAANWTLPQGRWRIVTVMTETRPETLDPLNPESSRRVIERFLNPFLSRTPPEAHKALNYFFQDELRLAGNGRLWSPSFAAEFEKRKGYDVRPKLAALFMDIGPETAKVRLDFNDVMVTLTGENYFKPIFDWHNSRGMIYACDPATRGKDPMEFGDYFRAMRWYTAPGFDTPGSSADLIKNKVGSSIAHLYRRPRVWVEGYHSLGWQASTATIFDSSNRNFLYGSTLLNLHGLYYATKGGWWEWAPPCYHFRMPYWRHIPVFLKYFERLSYLLSQGDHVADVAIINPHEPLVVDPARGEESLRLAHALGTELVTQCQTDFDFIDAESIMRAEIRDGRLAVSGEAYRVLVLPSMFAIRYASLERLVAFGQAGGRMVLLGELPTVTDRAGADDPQVGELIQKLLAPGGGGVRLGEAASSKSSSAQAIRALLDPPDFSGPEGAKALHRRVGPYEVYFVMDLKQRGECVFRAQGTPELWDAWTGSRQVLPVFTVNTNGTTTVRLDGNGAPLLVAFTPKKPGAHALVCDLDTVMRCASGIFSGLTVSGFARSAGEKTAVVEKRDGTRVTLKGQAAAPAAPLALDGEWGFTLVPTCDNRWGDFRLPASDGLIGAEARRMTWSVPGMPERMTYSHGPQFRMFGPLTPGTEADALEQALAKATSITADPAVTVNGKRYAWHPFCFSWREGVEDRPGYQNWHHGLNGNVGDEFFVLGKYDRWLYDVNMPKDAPPETRLYQTAVYAAEPCRAVITSTGVRPVSVWVGGQPRRPGETVELASGHTPLLVRYDAFGRAALVLRRADAPPFVQTHPLAMRWYQDPAVLPFDCFAGAMPQATYSFGAPPALERAEVTVQGELLAAKADGQAAETALVRTLPNGNRIYRVSPVDERHATLDTRRAGQTVTLTVRHAPGFYGGAVFPEPVRLTCGTGRMTLGDWARVDALRGYSGGAVYTREFTLNRAQAGQRCLLDLGDVGVSCGVSVNGRPEQVLTCPPWRVDVSDAVTTGKNRLSITVYNTLNNHYQTIPTRYRKPVEKAPSGLLGPVTLNFETRLELKEGGARREQKK